MKKLSLLTALVIASTGALADTTYNTWTFSYSGTQTFQPPQNCPSYFNCNPEVLPISGTFALTEPVDFFSHTVTTAGSGGPFNRDVTIDIQHGQLIEYRDYFDDPGAPTSSATTTLTQSGGVQQGEGYAGPWMQYYTSDVSYTLVSQVSAVAEPGEVALLLAGLGLLAIAAKRRAR